MVQVPDINIAASQWTGDLPTFEPATPEPSLETGVQYNAPDSIVDSILPTVGELSLLPPPLSPLPAAHSDVTFQNGASQSEYSQDAAQISQLLANGDGSLPPPVPPRLPIGALQAKDGKPCPPPVPLRPDKR